MRPETPTRTFREVWLGFMRDARGVTSIEYGLIAAFIALPLIPLASMLGVSLSELFNLIGGLF